MLHTIASAVGLPINEVLLETVGAPVNEFPAHSDAVLCHFRHVVVQSQLRVARFLGVVDRSAQLGGDELALEFDVSFVPDPLQFGTLTAGYGSCRKYQITDHIKHDLITYPSIVFNFT